MQNEKPITTATTTTTDFSSKTLHQRYVKQTHTNKDEKRDIKVKSQTSKMPKHEGINTRTKLKYHEHKHQITAMRMKLIYNYARLWTEVDTLAESIVYGKTK